MNKQTIHFDMELFQGYTQSTFPSISFQNNFPTHIFGGLSRNAYLCTYLLT